MEIKVKPAKKFKRLGYEKLPKKYNPDMIIYEKKEMNPAVQIIRVMFNINDKKVQFAPYYRYSKAEMEAVMAQLEELD